MEEKKRKTTKSNSNKKKTTNNNKKVVKKTTTKKQTVKKTPVKKASTRKETVKKTTQNTNKKTKTEKELPIIEEVKEIEKQEVVESTLNLESVPKKKKKVFRICLIAFILIVLASLLIIFAPKIKDYIEVKKLKNEISNIVEEQNVDDVKEMISNNITSGKRIEVEEKLENTALELINIKYSLDSIKNDNKINNSLTTSIIDDTNILELYEEKELILNELNLKIKDIYNKSQEYDIDFDKELYNDLLNEIYEIVKEEDINNVIEYINKTKEPLKYLKDNKDYYDISEDTFIFKKRKIKEEYDILIKDFDDSINYSKTVLIDDITPPVINAENITIYQGNSVDLKEKVKCIDEVDDEVECNIEGTFNSSKTGEYSIKITSVDKSNNISEKSIKVIVKAKPKVSSNMPYYIEVIRNQNVVVVYGKDSNNDYTNIVKVFVASVGRNGKTPTGTYKTTKGYAWGALIGGVYGQYTTRITGSYLFHSVPYYSQNKGDLEWEEYNKLGTAASAGCVRLAVRDAKWIYDNISNGTVVKIYDGNLPSGVTKPSAIKISGDSPNKGWDPTDPDPNNPWK